MFRSTSSFDRLLERATSHLLLEPDWNAILAICDTIRSGDVAAKYAVAAIKKKFYSDNPHVVLYALMLMESCVKNCGQLIHDEVCTKAFMEELRELVKHATAENVKQKILEMLQTWGMAFRNQSKYRIVTDTLNLMKAEGWKFPPVREAEAMFEADVAPEWHDGECCHRCRVQFGMMTRQHHCRGCGQVFCSKCSSKACPIPKFGIEKEVRVCDSCFDKFGPKDGSGPSTPKRTLERSTELPAEYLASQLSKQAQGPPTLPGGKSEAEIKEEEDLQLAIALSQSEAEEKEKMKLKNTAMILSGANKSNSNTSSTLKAEEKSVEDEEDLSPELMRYLNRNYWEQQQKENQQKVEVIQDTNGVVSNKSAMKKSAMKQSSDTPIEKQRSDLVIEKPITMPVTSISTTSSVMRPTDDELDEFVTTLKTQVEIFVNRMKSNSSRGRPIANDSSVQTLFMNTMAMHSKLLKHIQEQEDCRVHYEGLQDKITQVRDARAALDALREEERERRRREAEEAERLRQIQMREKLEVMRQKKQEYLQYQRQLALQRMQEQEREMMFRQEQAKQHYMLQQPQGVPMSGPGQPPMFHPAMYGPMSLPMTMGAPSNTQPPPPHFQPFIAPGQFPPMTSSVPATQPTSLTGMGGPPSMPMGLGGHLSAPDTSMTFQPPPAAPTTTSGAAFNLQVIGDALPSFPQSPNLHHQPMPLPPHMQQQQQPPQQPGHGLGMQQQPQPPPAGPPQQQQAASSAFDELISFD